MQERDSIMEIVAAVLHLGNIRFVPGNNDDAALADAHAGDALSTAATLLQVCGHRRVVSGISGLPNGFAFDVILAN